MVHTNDNEVKNTNAVNTNSELTLKKCKCGKFKKNIPPHLRDIICDFCKTYYHVQCSGISKASFLLLKQKGEHWQCFECMANVLPFSEIDNNE